MRLDEIDFLVQKKKNKKPRDDVVYLFFSFLVCDTHETRAISRRVITTIREE